MSRAMRLAELLLDVAGVPADLVVSGLTMESPVTRSSRSPVSVRTA